MSKILFQMVLNGTKIEMEIIDSYDKPNSVYSSVSLPMPRIENGISRYSQEIGTLLWLLQAKSYSIDLIKNNEDIIGFSFLTDPKFSNENKITLVTDNKGELLLKRLDLVQDKEVTGWDWIEIVLRDTLETVVVDACKKYN